ncbi:MAG: SIR2 family protein [Bacillota bacterium]|nr:SIR2 family protein [Bacillota bacterium]
MLNKTVYILGAGASKASNLPTQTEILKNIFSIRFDYNYDQKDIMSLDIDENKEKIREIYPKFDNSRMNLGDFILENFSSSDKLNLYRIAINHAKSIKKIDAQSMKVRDDYLFEAYEIAKNINVTLEDLFTIFDSVWAGREHFRIYSPEKMNEMHNEIKLCIVYSLAYSIFFKCIDKEYKKFANMIFNKRISTTQKEDSLALITTNWDDILEHSLYQLCNEYNIKNKKQHIYIDLCIYNDTLKKDSHHIPSTHIKAKGHKNIKILKMHGSLGWLECPKCGRIYTDFSRPISIYEYLQIPCPKCKNISNEGDYPSLRSLIITPTFMKSLTNLNIKNIWHNALIDIGEASELVFIGYSLPDADFEMRCLLKKAVRDDTHISVVLSEWDNPSKYDFTSRGFPREEAESIVKRMWLPEERYKSFFGEKRVEFFYKGFENYINNIGGKVNG